MADSTRTSEDFIEFTNDDLIEELQRRSRTMVMAMELPADCHTGEEDDRQTTVGFFHIGQQYARLGMAVDLLGQIRHQVCVRGEEA